MKMSLYLENRSDKRRRFWGRLSGFPGEIDTSIKGVQKDTLEVPGRLNWSHTFFIVEDILEMMLISTYFLTLVSFGPSTKQKIWSTRRSYVQHPVQTAFLFNYVVMN